MNPLLDLLGQPAHPRPRRQRLTMVLDKSLGCAAAQDLVDTAGPWIDTVKLGWGSAALYPEATLRRKIAIYRDAGLAVCPGGTFVETLFEAGRVAQALPLLKDLGFNALEVSNGIHPRMNRRDKQRIIAMAVNAGFLTTSEVGRKLPDEDQRLTPAQRMAEIRADLAAGADKVIIEARESGTVGIFGADGAVQAELAHELFLGVDPAQIIWEAPVRAQQVWLLKELGAMVNIGNVAPADVLSLESMRRGLRADTFRDALAGQRPRVAEAAAAARALHEAARGAEPAGLQDTAARAAPALDDDADTPLPMPLFDGPRAVALWRTGRPT